MRLRWTQRSNGLPPGQRLLNVAMPRFSDRPWDPPPKVGELRLAITIDRQHHAVIDAAAFAALTPEDMTADFHCVTTWSVQGVVWTGVPLVAVLASVGITNRHDKYVIVHASDHRRGNYVWEAAVMSDVVLATHINGEPLGPRHGEPVRLVAPQHYGYKSIKHVTSIDIQTAKPTRLGKEHLRGRVALEERSPTLPNWLARRPSRLLIGPTAALGERALRKSQR